MPFLVSPDTPIQCNCRKWAGTWNDLIRVGKVIILATCPKCGKTLEWSEAGCYRIVPENATILSLQ